MSGYTVTQTQRAEGASWGDLPSHTVIDVERLEEAGNGIAWRHVGHGVYYGNKNLGRLDLATYIARPR